MIMSPLVHCILFHYFQPSSDMYRYVTQQTSMEAKVGTCVSNINPIYSHPCHYVRALALLPFCNSMHPLFMLFIMHVMHVKRESASCQSLLKILPIKCSPAFYAALVNIIV